MSALLVTAVFILGAVQPHTARQPGSAVLGGSSWRLVGFQGGDGTTLTPAPGIDYTIAFLADGTLTARIDCNRGRGSWKSLGPSHLEFGPLAATRAQCPPGSLHDRIVKDWSYVRSFVIRNGHLFLSLMADAGIYEFEPQRPVASSLQSPVVSTGPVAYSCRQSGTAALSLAATFYRTEPAMVLVRHDGETRPAFQVRAASGTRYEGQDLLFWEARGEVLVTWSGDDLTCTLSKPPQKN